MLALSAFHAIRDALADVVAGAGPVPLDAPATAEAILRATGALAEGAVLPGASPS